MGSESAKWSQKQHCLVAVVQLLINFSLTTKFKKWPFDQNWSTDHFFVQEMLCSNSDSAVCFLRACCSFLQFLPACPCARRFKRLHAFRFCSKAQRSGGGMCRCPCFTRSADCVSPLENQQAALRRVSQPQCLSSAWLN